VGRKGPAERVQEMTTEQSTNLNRFEKRIPSNSKGSMVIRDLPNGGRAFQATSAGNNRRSHAVYEKQVDAAGQTILCTKTVFDEKNRVIHWKDKMENPKKDKT